MRVDNSPTAPGSLISTLSVRLPTTSFDDSVVPGFAVFEFSQKLACDGIIDCRFDVGTTIIDGGSAADHSLNIQNSNTGQTASGSAPRGSYCRTCPEGFGRLQHLRAA
ncbi:MAG: hypothetical protein O7F69_14720 [Alphaproteobacteria bacterium]|nr:hypothetical protein [Alphaproteobacteria bacterium]